jgi:hypothetical protein
VKPRERLDIVASFVENAVAKEGKSASPLVSTCLPERKREQDLRVVGNLVLLNTVEQQLDLADREHVSLGVLVLEACGKVASQRCIG